MAKFLEGFDLCNGVSEIIKSADELLFIISPFIKLHENYKSILLNRKDDDKLQIVLVFGKNEQDKSKCLSKEDWAFFKGFPNIEIRYEKRLHAKIYANDTAVMITSMNLYNFSQDHNIEAGVMFDMRKSILSSVVSSLNGKDFEAEVVEFIIQTIEQADLIYKNEPIYEDAFWGLTKNYKRSEVKVDNIDAFVRDSSQFEKGNHKVKFEKKQNTIKYKNENRNPEPAYGYCIRTGVKIPFNPDMPMCKEAYKSWAKFQNEDYPEKYCHYSGEPSNGQTTFKKPILNKNWAAAKKLMNFY